MLIFCTVGPKPPISNVNQASNHTTVKWDIVVTNSAVSSRIKSRHICKKWRKQLRKETKMGIFWKEKKQSNKVRNTTCKCHQRHKYWGETLQGAYLL